MISKRIKRLNLSPIMKFNELVEKIENEGVNVIKLNFGQSDLLTNKSYFKKLKFLKKITNRYQEPEGIKKLREIVSDYYSTKSGNNYSCNNVVITNGASDAIIKLLTILCDKNEEVIIIEPFFSDYRQYCDLVGVKLRSCEINDILLDLVQKKNK